jgi:xanthine/uracil/vitamin C permease (AzgA family)
LIAKKHGAPFVAELKPSKKLQRLTIVIHVIALGASLVNALPLAVKLAIAAVIGLNFKANFPQLKNEQRKIRHTEKLGWEISEGSEFEAVILLPSTIVTTFLIFLHIENKPAILVANDALSTDDYRQLLVKLKMTVH